MILGCGERICLLEHFSIVYVYVSYECAILLYKRLVASTTVSNSRRLGGCDGRCGNPSFFTKKGYLRNSFKNTIGKGLGDNSVAGIL